MPSGTWLQIAPDTPCSPRGTAAGSPAAPSRSPPARRRAPRAPRRRRRRGPTHTARGRPSRAAGRAAAATRTAATRRWTPRRPRPSTSSARGDRLTTFRVSRPPSRPTAPAIGTRSLSHEPWPNFWLARRRGGSSGSSCTTPFFPRVLVPLVGLDGGVGQRRGVGLVGRQGAGLDPVPPLQQVAAAAARLAGQGGGRAALGEAAEDQDALAGAEVGLVPVGAGDGVVDPAAGLAAVVEHRVAMVAVDVGVGAAAAGAAPALGVEQPEPPVVAGALVHRLGDREVDPGGCLPAPRHWTTAEPPRKAPTYRCRDLSRVRFGGARALDQADPAPGLIEFLRRSSRTSDGSSRRGLSVGRSLKPDARARGRG